MSSYPPAVACVQTQHGISPLLSGNWQKRIDESKSGQPVSLSDSNTLLSSPALPLPLPLFVGLFFLLCSFYFSLPPFPLNTWVLGLALPI
ncbi:hypothetical protein GQ457_05G007580 [Hibiscus cannabinus]